jgi:glucose/mannose-6-phosphate isomerase
MEKKITREEIKKLDEQDMLGKLKGFPAQCKESYSLPLPVIHDRKFNKIIFCGMGGSAISGDIISVITYEKSTIPCIVNRDYNLPLYADSKTLVIATSYSGNTEETISVIESAKKKGCSIIGISSNGRIEEMALYDKIPFIKIPGGYPPRCAMGYLFFPCYKIMSSLKVIPEINAEIFSRIKNWSESFSPEEENNTALAIAEHLYNKIPIIYSDRRFLPATTRWKTQIAENSKSFSFINVLPEMNHNEIMSWRYPDWFIKKCIPVFITSGKEHPRTKLRFEITGKIITGIQPEILNIKAEGLNLLEEIFYLIIMGDWVSFYLAMLNKVNPTEINEINLLKKQLGGKL